MARRPPLRHSPDPCCFDDARRIAGRFKRGSKTRSCCVYHSKKAGSASREMEAVGVFEKIARESVHAEGS